ncbi:MAG TPA: methylated-DNA--[protein]-cysteine S-methyltransferase [Clostridiales bacterium]|nr:methylated-DNA--[protein]-cysteine S-methyltransferase [Clostridiales bacterium]
MIGTDGRAITLLALPGEEFPPGRTYRSAAEVKKPVAGVKALLDRAESQLREYLAGRCKEFNLPLALEGTEFQKAVWQALMEIPYGETRSYAEVARAIGRPKACRAVGQANHRNPIPIIVPCHRVIGQNGSLVGFGGGLDLKRRLLDMEKHGI